MKRTFWAVSGMFVGIYVVRKVSKVKQQITSEGMKSFTIDFARNLKNFSSNTVIGMKQREEDLKKALGLLENNFSRKESREKVENPFSKR